MGAVHRRREERGEMALEIFTGAKSFPKIQFISEIRMQTSRCQGFLYPDIFSIMPCYPKGDES
jgi:hypothetical protein